MRMRLCGGLWRPRAYSCALGGIMTTSMSFLPAQTRTGPKSRPYVPNVETPRKIEKENIDDETPIFAPRLVSDSERK